MARIHELLGQLRMSNPSLAAEIEREVDVLSERRAFGLNFERHTPEAVELPGRRVRVGDKVRVRPRRGELLTAANKALYRVVSIERRGDRREAMLAPISDESDGAEAIGTRWTTSVDELVVVAEFRDPIYPGLVSTGRVERGGDKPFHTVINAENFHALQTLLFTHRGKVDCIYIDPPYNTGAKDWKYNNDYVEAEDLYRHSKWLAFMERRLLLAKELLNPDDSVLIVTIDEKEYLRLGMLLEQTFPEARIQMVSIQINGASVSRSNAFGRTDEYAFFVYVGGGGPAPIRMSSDWVTRKGVTHRGEIRWDRLIRSGTNARRVDRPNLFFPLEIDKSTGAVVDVGKPLALHEDLSGYEPRSGAVAVWPIRADGSHGNWQISPTQVVTRLSQGALRVGGNVTRGFTPYYLKEGEYKKVVDGVYEVVGHRADGSLITNTIGENSVESLPSTQWRIDAHDASHSGSRLLLKLLPGRKFPFPKSLYAVEDTLRFFVARKPNAVVLDFFSGSGTTAHAVMRLNKQDGGRRLSISVTNNEVSADEQRTLRQQGLQPGDPAWEKWGICDYITKPRIEAAITGKTPDGEPIKGDYRFTDEYPMADGLEENVEFLTLTYEAAMRVQSNREFARIAPFLWLRAGCRGRRIESLDTGWDVADFYGVLADLDQTDAFLSALAETPAAEIAYIVTDEDRLFEAIARELPPGIEPVRLYQSYLSNFEIDAMRSLR